MDMQSRWEEIQIVIEDICGILENHDLKKESHCRQNWRNKVWQF